MLLVLKNDLWVALLLFSVPTHKQEITGYRRRRVAGENAREIAEGRSVSIRGCNVHKSGDGLITVVMREGGRMLPRSTRRLLYYYM